MAAGAAVGGVEGAAKRHRGVVGWEGLRDLGAGAASRAESHSTAEPGQSCEAC